MESIVMTLAAVTTLDFRAHVDHRHEQLTRGL
jgi:hypothetical protein